MKRVADLRSPARRLLRPATMFAAIAAACVTLFAGSRPARAEGPAACTVFEIKASNPPQGGIDPALKPLEKKLQKGPFKAWKRFYRLAKHDLQLSRMTSEEIALVPGKLSVLMRGVVRDEGRKARLRLSLTIDNKDGKRVINTGTEQDSGDFFLIVDGRLPIPGGDYILALGCTAPPTP